jgi:hypothetical protein
MGVQVRAPALPKNTPRRSALLGLNRPSSGKGVWQTAWQRGSEPFVRQAPDQPREIAARGGSQALRDGGGFFHRGRWRGVGTRRRCGSRHALHDLCDIECEAAKIVFHENICQSPRNKKKGRRHYPARLPPNSILCACATTGPNLRGARRSHSFARRYTWNSAFCVMID